CLANCSRRRISSISGCQDIFVSLRNSPILAPLPSRCQGEDRMRLRLQARRAGLRFSKPLFVPVAGEVIDLLPSTAVTTSMPPAKRAALTGWGRYPSAESDIFRPEKLSELAAIVGSNATSVIARGAGRAYGDAALNQDHRVVDLQRLNRMLAFDSDSGLLRCEAAVPLAAIIEAFLRRVFFPPVVPGTQFVTLGGSVAADIHGKSHHRDSSLATHVTSIELMLASGEVTRCS